MKQSDQGGNDLPVGLSQPARRALIGAGYLRLEQLTEVSEDEIKQLHGMGPKAIGLLRHALETLGLSRLENLSQGYHIFSRNFSFALPLTFSFARPGTWLTYLFATVMLLFVVFNLNQFAKRSTTPGSIYAYIGRGLGARGGVL